MNNFFFGYNLSCPTSTGRSFERLDSRSNGTGQFVAQLYREHSVYATSYTQMMDHELFRSKYSDRFDNYPLDISELLKERHDPFFQDLIRFYICLRIWRDLSNSTFDNIENIWYRSLTEGPKYTTYLDDLYAYSYRHAYGISYILPEGQEVVPVTGYSDIFPARFLPRWKEETNDIEEYALTDVYIDEGTLEEVLFEFEKMVYDTKEIEIIDPDELAMNVKDSSSYIDGVKKKGFELTWSESTRVSLDYIGYEEKILVYPSGMRDTVILEKGSSNMIRWAERQLGEIMYNQKESVYSKGHDRLSDFIDIFRSRSGLHILRDIKKCGLTCPIPQFIDHIIAILKKYHPGVPWDNLRIYKYPRIRLQSGEWVTMKRGVGLGMANTLTTLLCIGS